MITQLALFSYYLQTYKEGLSNTISKVHKDCSRAKIKRDAEYIQLLVEFLCDRKPFSTEIFQLKSHIWTCCREISEC